MPKSTRRTSRSKTSQSKRTRQAKAPRGWSLIWRRSQALVLSFLVVTIAIGLATTTLALQTSKNSLSEYNPHDVSATKQLRALSGKVASFETAEQIASIQVVPTTKLEEQLANIEVEIEIHNHHAAMNSIGTMGRQLAAYQNQLDQLIQAKQAAATAVAASAQTQKPSGPSASALTLPILIYHKTPSDFSAQLDTLAQKGYHSISMTQVAAGLRNPASLPPKPAAITFDDGFADQMDAFSILQQHHMVATYYIIDGGPDSQWCIGAGRRYNDPVQPPGGCGDAYLNWDQVRQLDASGIITIASHTIDHPDLSTEPPAQQQYEIVEGKHQLEAQIGHPVYDFAYPYGSFNAATLQIVQQAGFRTAVTTTPGIAQSLAGIYTLRRVRDPNTLP